MASRATGSIAATSPVCFTPNAIEIARADVYFNDYSDETHLLVMEDTSTCGRTRPQFAERMDRSVG